MRLRPHSADSTMLRVRPTGQSVGIAPVDYDPVVPLKPFGPRLAADALPSENSPMAAPGQPICIPAFAVVPSLSIPFHHLRPVRHYPHLWISARGLGLSGTSTHLTRQLSGTHYRAVRPSPAHRYFRPHGWSRLCLSHSIAGQVLTFHARARL